MQAISRVLGAVTRSGSAAGLGRRVVVESRRSFGVTSAVLLSIAEVEGRLQAVAIDPGGDPPIDVLPLADLDPVADAVARRAPVEARGSAARALVGALGVGAREGLASGVPAALILPLRQQDAVTYVLVLVEAADGVFAPEEVEVAEAFAAAAAAGLAQLELAQDRAAQAALARAAKTLNESLDPNRVLVRICEESAAILDADNAAVYLGDGEDGLRTEAAFGHSTEVIGARLAPGEGLAGKAAAHDRAMLTNDYQGMPRRPRIRSFSGVRSCLAVPMHWDRRLQGVLAVGYTRPHLVTRDDLRLLEAFAELAAAACRNASAHAGLAMAARTDGLTGCLNHAALHEALRLELERSRRTGRSLSLALVDLDDFKDVNERHGHLAGDEVLRRVGQALRQAVRAYDVVARYGGDEFAIVAADSDERAAAEVAGRAVRHVRERLDELGSPPGAGRATAGVAEWAPGESPAQLVERADRALLFGKQAGTRGAAIRASTVASGFRPVGSSRRRERGRLRPAQPALSESR